jgi:RNA-directed DNA polymerase
MWQMIEGEIERKARRILAKHRREHFAAQKHAKRFTRRTGRASAAAPLKNPSYWQYDNHFDPIYCIKHARFIAKGIWSSIQKQSYAPRPSIQFNIDKPGGGFREIMVFSIPDSAVANIIHRKLTNRNRGLFSAYSFAYRPDKTIFEAIIHLQRMMQPSKTYILQYDYSKYFDTIDHKYLEKLIQESPFVITKAERGAIKSFLCHKYLPITSWQTRNWRERDKGVPQGSSLSLFLSNLAAQELDMELERLNGSFVRFADDALAVAHSYKDARNIELEFRRHCLKTGVAINFEKSSGIALLSGRKSDDNRDFFLDGDDGADLKQLQFVDFLGHRVSASEIDLTNKAVKRIKRKISQIIYIHLLQYPRQKPPLPINPARLGAGFLDWDLITCLNEIRRYIYGGLKHADLTRFIDKDIKLKYVRGLLAFYPLVSHPRTLKELDGWLKNVMMRGIRERNKLISAQNLPTYTVKEDDLLSGDWHVSPIPGSPNETSLPSFVMGWRAARKFYKRYGLSEIEAPSYYSLMSLYS